MSVGVAPSTANAATAAKKGVVVLQATPPTTGQLWPKGNKNSAG